MPPTLKDSATYLTVALQNAFSNSTSSLVLKKTHENLLPKEKNKNVGNKLEMGEGRNTMMFGTYFLFLSFLNLITAKYKSFMRCTASGVAGVCVKLETV